MSALAQRKVTLHLQHKMWLAIEVHVHLEVFNTGIILLLASTKQQKQTHCRSGVVAALAVAQDCGSVLLCVDLNAGCCHV